MIGGLAPGSIALHNGAAVTVDNTLFILANGSIGGNGTYSAQTVVNDGGNNGPGNSAGTLIIEGDYEQTATGKLTIETNGLGDGEFDLLHVTGDVTLGGTLEILFPGAYLPKAATLSNSCRSMERSAATLLRSPSHNSCPIFSSTRCRWRADCFLPRSTMQPWHPLSC